MQPLKRAVIYVEYQQKNRLMKEIVSVPKKKCVVNILAKTGYEVVHVYVEQGESAKTALRTELQKMLLFCSDKKNKINAVVIYKLDRLFS